MRFCVENKCFNDWIAFTNHNWWTYGSIWNAQDLLQKPELSIVSCIVALNTKHVFKEVRDIFVFPNLIYLRHCLRNSKLGCIVMAFEWLVAVWSNRNFCFCYRVLHLWNALTRTSLHLCTPGLFLVRNVKGDEIITNFGVNWWKTCKIPKKFRKSVWELGSGHIEIILTAFRIRKNPNTSMCNQRKSVSYFINSHLFRKGCKSFLCQVNNIISGWLWRTCLSVLHVTKSST